MILRRLDMIIDEIRHLCCAAVGQMSQMLVGLILRLFRAQHVHLHLVIVSVSLIVFYTIAITTICVRLLSGVSWRQLLAGMGEGGVVDLACLIKGDDTGVGGGYSTSLGIALVLGSMSPSDNHWAVLAGTTFELNINQITISMMELVLAYSLRLRRIVDGSESQYCCPKVGLSC